MSIYLDLKYINLISARLENFKQKNQFLFNFRCPLCGDSQTKQNKSRGFFYKVPNKNDMAYKCHNCAASMYFGNFLKTFAPTQYGEYIVERFRNEKPIEPANMTYGLDFKPNFGDKEQRLLDKLLDRLDTLPADNIAVQFARMRMIPESMFDRLYYIDDVSRIEQLSDKYKNKLTKGEPRLVIPAYNEQGQLEGVTCRALQGEALRYITIKIKEDAAMIFGREHLDKGKTVYAVEGPIDSLFIPNSISMGGSSFSKVGTLGIPKEQIIIILDNQPRNKEICQIYRSFVEAGYRICIWPEYILEKDINDIVLSGKTAEEVKAIIDDNTYQGLNAQLKFSAWRKC